MALFRMRKSWTLKALCFIQALAFIVSTFVLPIRVYAQTGAPVPAANGMAKPGEVFTPALLRGFRVEPNNPLTFDFIVDQGDAALDGQPLQDEGKKLIKYFLTALTVPSKDLWVNLSPYENNRIIPEKFGQTEMGRDLLAQDYILKQLTASLMYPETDLGKEFWKRIYARAHQLFGTTNIPIDTFNKVWIMPDRAKVYEKGNNVYLVDAKMKVMLETDYLAQSQQPLPSSVVLNGQATQGLTVSTSSAEMTKQIIREVILPVIEKEINEGKEFAQLRQVHYSLILAAWYEKKIKDSFFGKAFVGQNKVAGNASDDPMAKEKIYAQYVEAFKAGAYNYIKDEVDVYSREVIARKYFSGGYSRGGKVDFEQALLPKQRSRAVVLRTDLKTNDFAESHGSTGYIQEVRQEAKEGDEVVLRAVLNDPQASGKYKVILYSNKDKDRVWRDGEELKYVGEENGKPVFEIRVKAERSFSYTFAFEGLDGKRAWADLPYGNGQVQLEREFKGSIVYTGMEFKPFVQRGGQADVMFELARAMAKKGKDVTVILPYFKNRAKAFGERYIVEDVEGLEITIPFQNRPPEKLKVKKSVVDGITVYFLDAESADLFDEPYKSRYSEFYESILLSQGTLELLKALGKKVDVIQSNDHHTGLVDLYMQMKYKDTFKATGSHFSIHNAGYQGEYGDMIWVHGDPARKRAGQFLKPWELANKIKEGEFFDDQSTWFDQDLLRRVAREDLWDIENTWSFQELMWKIREGQMPGFSFINTGDLINDIGLGNSPEIRGLLTVDGKINMMAAVPKTMLYTGGRGQTAGTVSPAYGEDILKTSFGTDLLFQEVHDTLPGHLVSVLNGIDFEIQNPATDKILPYNYSINEGVEVVLSTKKKIKRDLQRSLNKEKGEEIPSVDRNAKTGALKKHGYLIEDPDRMLVVALGRAVKQKQFDIVADTIEGMWKDPSRRKPVDFIVAGPADKNDEDGLRAMQRIIELANNEEVRAAGINIVVLHGFVSELANLIYAAADLFLVPSDFEPAGIVQQIALRYGTLVLARATGGLRNTVFEGGDKPNGFVFHGRYRSPDPGVDGDIRYWNAQELYAGVSRAYDMYSNHRDRWEELVKNGMEALNDWGHRLYQYETLYANIQEEASLDNATATNIQGGVDFGLNNVNIDIQSDGAQGAFNFDPALLNNGHFDGLVPMIRSILPVTDLGAFFASGIGQPLVSVN